MKNEIKILYLRTNYWFNLKAGGSVGHTAGVINSLNNVTNIEVISNDILAEVKQKIKIIKPVRLFFRDDINEFLYNFKIIMLLKKEIKKYDFIYHRYNSMSFSSTYLSKKYNIPLILEYNGSEVWILKKWGTTGNPLMQLLKKVYYFFKLPIVFFIENYNLKQASLIVVVSKAMKDELIKRGIDKNKILINPNGVDIEKFNPNIKAYDIKKKYGLENKIILGFIGTFGPWHGAENIVKAYGELLKEIPEIKSKTKLLMIGDGVKIPEVKKYIKKYGIEDNVILTGLIPQEKAPKYLSVCDVLINATVPNPDGSEFFGSPTKLFEYMAMGKAIISSNLGQMREILENDKTAILVKGGDMDELKIVMEKLIKDKKLREILSKNAREEVVKNYTWDKHVDRILKRIKKFKIIN
jgi:glycosyltransferase involved in cell wall biosynthesis